MKAMAFLDLFRRGVQRPVFRKAADPDPDLQFAAKGYAQVAITRRHAPQIDLHSLERGFAEELLSEGCTMDQALSARWGGAYAISDPLSDFDQAIVAYKETATERGLPFNRCKEDAARMYDVAAALVIATAHVADPREYGRFLRHINQG
jgi:hypothetical protein